MVYKFKIYYRSLGGSSNGSKDQKNTNQRKFISFLQESSDEEGSESHVEQSNDQQNTNQENTNQENTNQQNTNQQNTNQENTNQENTNQQNTNQQNTNQQSKNQKNTKPVSFFEVSSDEEYFLPKSNTSSMFENTSSTSKQPKSSTSSMFENTNVYVPPRARMLQREGFISTSSKNESISSNSKLSKSELNMANDKKSISSEISEFELDSNKSKSKELNTLLIIYHDMKLGNLNEDNINLLTNRLTEKLKSDKIDDYRNNCFIREQNLIAKRDKLLQYKFHDFNPSSQKYKSSYWRDNNLVQHIYNYTHYQDDKPAIRFREQFDIVNSTESGVERKKAANLATLAMKGAINNYYENILNQLREECKKEIERLMDPNSKKEFPDLSEVYGKEK